MEIRFYTPGMDFIGVMENHRSLVWRRKFYEPGEFKLYAPITEENLRLTERGNLVWIKGHTEAGVIEGRYAEETASKSQIEVTGRFLSSYMDRRLIRPTVTFSGRVEVAMRQLLSDAVALPLVTLGALNGFAEEVSFQATYKNLLAYESKLSKTSGIGFRFRPDFVNKSIYFETYKGTDRTASQNTTNRVIFSETYDNLEETTYQENNQTLKNVFYVGGQGAGGDRVYVSFGDAAGLDRREVFVDARDITQEDGMTDAEYQEKLLQRGYEKQTEYQETKAVTCLIDADANFKYREDYDLGDIVTVRKTKWGISLDLKITEVEEVYEKGRVQIAPVFGSPLPETVDWRDE